MLGADHEVSAQHFCFASVSMLCSAHELSLCSAQLVSLCSAALDPGDDRARAAIVQAASVPIPDNSRQNEAQQKSADP